MHHPRDRDAIPDVPDVPGGMRPRQSSPRCAFGACVEEHDSCRHAVRGCKFTGGREAVAQHEPGCGHVPVAIVGAPWVAQHTCKCTLKYTDLHNLAIGVVATRGGCPDAAYDAQGHYICSGCLKDWCFTGQSEPRRPLKFKGREEQNGWAFHCDHGVDVCMRCAKKNFGQKKYE